MSIVPFEPVGERPRWAMILDELRTLDVGGVLTYDAAAAVLDLEPLKDRGLIQAAVRRAAVTYARDDQRALEAVPNVGYRVVEAREHLRLAKTHQRKSSRSLRRASMVVEHVDVTRLDPETRKAFGVVAQALSAQAAFSRRLDIRQRDIERRMAAVEESATHRSERTDGELATVRERLERLERLATGGE